MDKQTQVPQAHLLGIPRELRDEIYGYTFAEKKIDLDNDNALIDLGGLTLACKQLYCETYKTHLQRTLIVTGDEKKFFAWLKRHDKKALQLYPPIQVDCAVVREPRFHSTYPDHIIKKWRWEELVRVTGVMLHTLREARELGYKLPSNALFVKLWTEPLGGELIWTSKPAEYYNAYTRTHWSDFKRLR